MVYLIGFLTGILSGMAVGGGTLLVPALIFFQGLCQHAAQGISLASFLPTAVVAAITHYRQGNVNLRLALYLVIGSIAGALGGAMLAGKINDGILQKVFGLFLIFMGIYEFKGKNK